MSAERYPSLRGKTKTKMKAKTEESIPAASISTAPNSEESGNTEDCSSILVVLSEQPRSKEKSKEPTTQNADSSSGTPNTPHKRKVPIIGYVHTLSPVKRIKSNSFDYSTLTIQTSQQEIKEALLYSSGKRGILSKSGESRTPVKIQNYIFTADGKKLIINDMCKLSVPDQSEYAFQFNENASLICPQVLISDVFEKYQDWDVVGIIAKVVQILPKKTVQAGDKNGELRLAEAILCDSSGCIRLDVWQENIEKINVGSVYEMRPLQVRTWSRQKKLVTMMHSRFTAVVNEVLQNLTMNDDPNESLGPTSAVITVSEISSVEKVEKICCCMNCRKPIMQTSATLFARCDRCGHTMRVRDCSKDFRVKFVVTSKDEKKVSLLAY